VRAFNARYGETFPEPKAVYTEAPVVLGTDGVKKMSKSIGNTIEVLAGARHDPQAGHVDDDRHAADPSNRPRAASGLQCLQLHRHFGDDYEEIWEGERTARAGCVDTKKLLAQRIIDHYAPARETLSRAHGPTRSDSAAFSTRVPSASGRSPRPPWPRSANGWVCDSAPAYHLHHRAKLRIEGG